MARLLKQRPQQTKAFADINVTPMVDVMLVLLVIFMVAAPLMTAQIEVDLPDSGQDIAQFDEPPVELSVRAGGALFLGTNPVSLDNLDAALAAEFANRSDQTIYLRADGENSYSEIFGVMAQLQAMGYSRISLVGSSSNDQN